MTEVARGVLRNLKARVRILEDELNATKEYARLILISKNAEIERLSLYNCNHQRFQYGTTNSFDFLSFGSCIICDTFDGKVGRRILSCGCILCPSCCSNSESLVKPNLHLAITDELSIHIKNHDQLADDAFESLGRLKERLDNADSVLNARRWLLRHWYGDDDWCGVLREWDTETTADLQSILNSLPYFSSVFKVLQIRADYEASRAQCQSKLVKMLNSEVLTAYEQLNMLRLRNLELGKELRKFRSRYEPDRSNQSPDHDIAVESKVQLVYSEYSNACTISLDSPVLARPTPTMTVASFRNLDTLIRGAVLLKFAYNGSGDPRWVIMSADGLCIRWGDIRLKSQSDSFKNTANLGRCLGILFGTTSTVFCRLANSLVIPRWRCFSLVFESRTVDFGCVESDEQAEEWYFGLREAIKRIGYRQFSTAIKKRFQLSSLTRSQLVTTRAVWKLKEAAFRLNISLKNMFLNALLISSSKSWND